MLATHVQTQAIPSGPGRSEPNRGDRVATIGFVLLVYAAAAATRDPSGLFTRENAETLLIPPALTFAFVPLIWASGWISRREQENLRRRFQARYDSAG